MPASLGCHERHALRGPMFITNPDGLTADEMREGMRVRLTFLEVEDAMGAFLLPFFEREMTF